MTLVGLSWYLSGMLALLHLLFSLITFGPEAEAFVITALAGTACGSLAFAGLACYLRRLPQRHWIHHSKPVWVCYVVLASAVTLVVIALG
jgi:hypothetical protein